MAKIIAKVIDLSRHELVADKFLCGLIGIITFALLTGTGAFFRIPLPFTPVPLTLQTFFVLLSGAVLGSRKAFYSQILAFSMGAAGVTAFAAGKGWLVIFGPTGGYLLGFMLAALFVGLLHKYSENPSFLFSVWAMALGNLIILGLGTIRLAAFVGGMEKALLLGFYPFIIGDIIKIISAAALFQLMARRSKQIFYS
jgi:biotin transport system substrate-specific component